MKKRLLLLFCLISVVAAAQKNPTIQKGQHVADIHFDAKMDDPSFRVCDEGRVEQYYAFGDGFQYKGE